MHQSTQKLMEEAYRQAGDHLCKEVVDADLTIGGPIRGAEYSEAGHAIDDGFGRKP